MSEILEVAWKLTGFSAPSYMTRETRVTTNAWVCMYHNQYEHSTDRCRILQTMLERMIKVGQLREFVDRGGAGVPQDSNKRPRTEEHNRLLPPPPEMHKEKIYMISGVERGNICNLKRKVTIRQVRRIEDEVMEIQEENG